MPEIRNEEPDEPEAVQWSSEETGFCLVCFGLVNSVVGRFFGRGFGLA